MNPLEGDGLEQSDDDENSCVSLKSSHEKPGVCGGRVIASGHGFLGSQLLALMRL